MKRLLSSGLAIVILIMLVLGLWGNSMLGRVLDARLPPLLSDALGVPVRLAPIEANLWQLTARSSSLALGKPGNEALQASDIEIDLDWADLLRGEIHPVRAAGNTLDLQLSRWPANDSPAPDSYEFLQPWLPDSLHFSTVKYLQDDAGDYTLSKVSWQREANGGVNLALLLQDQPEAISLSARLKSLVAALQLARAELDLTAEIAGKAASKIAITTDIRAAATAGYQLQATVSAAGATLQLSGTGNQSWQLPASSTTSIDTLDIGQLRALINSYTGPTASQDTAELLAAKLPRLNLPQHDGSVAISELRLGDEIGRDTAFKFSTGAGGASVAELNSAGPTGTLQGNASINSADSGWQVTLGLELAARAAGQSIAAQYTGADWLWRTGHARLSGQGATWGELLNSMQGGITAAGSHRGATLTPVSMDARLDNRPGDFALDEIAIQLGEGQINGSASLSAAEPRRLELRLKATELDLDFLFSDQATPSPAGVAIPDYLGALPGIELDWRVQMGKLRLPGASLASAELSLVRTATKGELIARVKDQSEGSLDMRLDASMPPGKPGDMKLVAKLVQLDLSRLFQQEDGLLDTRSSGTLSFSAQGKGLDEVFRSMRGKAGITVEFRSDDNWGRASTAAEQLQFAGSTRLVTRGDRIVGLQISELDIKSIQQDLTGTLSLAADSSPWLVADLKSSELDVPALMKLQRPSPAGTTGGDQLESIKRLGAVTLSIEIQTLRLLAEPLSDIRLEVASAPNSMSVKRLDLSVAGGRIESQAALKWEGGEAILAATATASDFDLDAFLINSPPNTHVPVTGSIGLNSSGKTFAQLMENLVGHVDLKSSGAQARSAPADRRKLSVTAKQLGDGMHAQVKSLQWGESELAGTLRYHKTEPPLWELEITDGALSLLPWEAQLGTPPKAEKAAGDGSTITRAAKASAGFLGRVLLAPARLITGPREAAPGQKLFSSKPLPLDALRNIRAQVKGHIGTFTSKVAVARDLDITATMDGGQLALQLKAGQLNNGKAELHLALDAQAQPATAQLTATVEGVYGKPEQDNSYPRSAYLALNSQGASQAELAANLNGLAYIELGQGPLDVGNAKLLTADIATSMFKALVPGTGKQGPELDCAITLAVFNEGIGTTPHGYGGRTRRANLVGRVGVNLKTEMLELEVDSRNREGLGLSVASVFSNTVKVKGPLTHPAIVPNTTGILWRSWAALMTGGMSIVGEGLYKRALGSENPCVDVNKEIRKKQCGAGQPLSASVLACPPAA